MRRYGSSGIYDESCAACCRSESGMCERHRQEYGRRLRARYEASVLAERLFRETEARCRVEDAERNERHGLPNGTEWTIPFDPCDCAYCAQYGTHPELPLAERQRYEPAVADER